MTNSLIDTDLEDLFDTFTRNPFILRNSDDYLENYSEVSELEGLYRHITKENDFIYRALPDLYETGWTYEFWKEAYMEHIGDLVGVNFTSITEINSGPWFSDFHLVKTFGD